jgi:hypothetical protein
MVSKSRLRLKGPPIIVADCPASEVVKPLLMEEVRCQKAIPYGPMTVSWIY